MCYSQTPNCNCCSDFHLQFDFWVGDWIVTDTLGNKLGENTIIKLENGCILSEHWRGEKGGTGRSFNYFNSTDSTWNQTWISGSGNILELKGIFYGNKMVLKSELIHGNQGNYYNQITWKKRSDESVLQLWEIFDEQNNKQQTAFKGIYVRRIDSISKVE